MSAAIFPPPTLAFYTPLIAGGLLIALVLASIWMFGLAKCLQNPALTRRRKMAWALFILIFNFMGACLYLAYHVDTPSQTPGSQPRRG
jgi:hypothetical protein